MMKVRQVLEIAKEWVDLNAGQMPGFCGAHLMGSLSAMAGEDDFQTYKDVDIGVALKEKGQQDRAEVAYKGILLEVGFYDFELYKSPDKILASAELAFHLASQSLLADPTGTLTQTHEIVAREYARRKWVRARYEPRRQGMPFVFAKWSNAATVTERVLPLLYSVQSLTSMVAIARLKPPTLRKCLVLFKDLLKGYPGEGLQEEALTILGFAHLTREQVQHYLAQFARAFDLAVQVKRTPFPLDFKLYAHLRPYFVDTSLEMIEEGNYREAMWWILAGIYVANVAIQNDALEADKREHQDHFELLLHDLGLRTEDDWRERLETAQRFAERVYESVEQIIEHNPEIAD